MESESKTSEVSVNGDVISNSRENEEKNKKEKENQNTAEKDKSESGRQSSMDKPGVREQSDNEDSEVDDYNLTEDQKRALEELDNLKTEMGCYPDEDPPEYDVTERLKILNEDLKNDPTPVEKQKESKVGFKQNLVDLVAPPPDFSDDEGGDKQNSPKNKNKPQVKQTEEKTDKGDKVDDKSETIPSSKKSNGTSSGKKDEVLIEIDGQFQLVSADDVRAKDLGYIMDQDKNNDQNENKNKENEKKQNEKNKNKMQPSPPGKPRPATAQANSRRSVRPTSSSSSSSRQQQRQRPHSASASTNHGSSLSNFNYNSPYALSPREKELMEERKKALEKEKQERDRKKKQEEQDKERENQDAFEYWLKKKRETDRRRKVQDEEERKKNEKEDRQRIKEFEKNKGFSTYDNLYYKADSEYSDEKAENEEAFKGWLKEKNSQFKKEKLLKRRQDQEMHEGYYIRSREDCEKAYKQWLKHKATEARKARANERQKAKLQRLAARRSRKSISLSKSIQESQSFRYVDYYGYRF